MSRDPLAAWWRHRVTVTPHDGTDAYGTDVFGEPFDLLAWVDDTRRVVVGSDGSDQVSETTVYAPITSPDVPGGSTLTLPPVFGDRVVTVLAVSRHDGGGMATPDHVELATR